ncbi:MAG TPA: hypothetical protein VLR90_02420, partial [Blastocatellia bacterium]|nr:hypothetical protein [Blastocatellia bacterium]
AACVEVANGALAITFNVATSATSTRARTRAEYNWFKIDMDHFSFGFVVDNFSEWNNYPTRQLTTRQRYFGIGTASPHT